MLPQKWKIGLTIGLLFTLSACTEFANAGESRSNILYSEPVNCYVCSSAEDCAESLGTIRKCENNVAETCLIVFDESNTIQERGCSDTVLNTHTTYCTENPSKCPSCSSSGCNNANSLDQYVECVSCDSKDDKNCVLNPSAITSKTLCNGGCLTSLYPVDSSSTDTSDASYHLARTCLNDVDLDEQEKCADGNDANCVACEEANCNVHSVPADRHSCYHCTDDDCEDDEVQQCITYKKNDQCFYQFDAVSNDVINMGCASSLASSDELINLVKSKSLYLCDGSDCNGFANIPQTHECTACSSDSLEVCATQPSAATTRNRCNIPPYTQCYERMNSENDGATERGCLSDLSEDDFYNCLTGADENCKICSSDGCNENIIPADRLQCQRCSSSSDANCHAVPSSLSICPSYKADDTCVTSFQSGVTTRGCSSEFSCDSTLSNCEVCSGNGCNTVNLRKRAEESYGAFQDLPLNCNTCSGEECLTGVLTARKCNGDEYQDCLTVFNSDGQVIRRGCETLVEAEYASYCNSNPDLCFSCKSNGCNVVTDATNVQQCLYCDAASNADCLLNPSAITTRRKCVEGCVSSLYERKSDTNVFEFIRTCFEDIEEDDRVSCTKENNCVKCTDNDCNTDILPAEGRLSCLHCDGADCNVPESKSCNAYSQNDRCYMYFDSTTHSVIRMGCATELTESQIQAEIKEYFICDGDNCNDFSNLPEAKACYTCSSTTNEYCATDPSKLTSRVRCQFYPYTECVSRIIDGGHTERGCFRDLPDEDFVSCLNGDDSATCKICTEDNCNNAIYPAGRQQCYRCNSADDSNCESSPTTAQACLIYNEEDDSCITKLVNGITYRACSSELSCEDSDRKSCSTCTGNNCNTVNLIESDIGNPGIFQALPLNCYHCDSSEECSSSLGILRKCENNELQTCTVAFSESGLVVQRSCSDAIEETCAKDNNKCYDCKSSGCNVATQQSDYVDCIFCDAQNSDSCTFDVASITRTRKCLKGCMTALYPRTDSETTAYDLLRTCLDDMDIDDQEECLAGNSEKCKACTTAKCNTDIVGTRKSCYHCTDDSCQDPQQQTCSAVMDNDQCFIKYDETGSIVEMGCKSKYDADELKLLVTAKRLWFCDADDCNTIDNVPAAQTCTICSSRTDENCAIAPQDVSSTTTCSNTAFTQCYSRLLENGHTERGCLVSLEDDEFYNCFNQVDPAACLTCVGNNCNKEIYPADRRTCQVCSSDSSDTCEVTPDASTVCSPYSSTEKCVAAIDANGYTVRGCQSDVSCVSTAANKCQTCDSNDCNTSNLKRKQDANPGVWQSVPLTCQSCTSEDDCKSSTSTLRCSRTEYCMTVFGESGAVVMRGCSNAVEAVHESYCDRNPDNCHNCNSNQCNSATSLSDYIECIYCNSNSDSTCVSNPTAVNDKRKCHKQCMTALYQTSSTSGYVLTRTCLDDKDEADQVICQNGSENCVACSGASCNSIMLPADRLSCYSCQGEACEDPETSYCPTYKSDDQCYMLFNSASDIVQMGCVSDLTNAFVNSNSHLMYTCSDANCNGFENIPKTKMCLVCNSNDDEDCASNPDNIVNVQQCTALPNTQCYTRINTDTSTERGCVSSLSTTVMRNCLNGRQSNCVTCDNERCNIDIYPADRLSCHRCNSKDDTTCDSSPNAAQICPHYSATDYCGTKLVNGYTYRDCASEFICDENDKQYCRMCSTGDNCNTVDLISLDIGTPGKWQALPINCYTCVGDECENESLGVIQKCHDNNLQTCGTVFDTNGKVLQRGCSDLIYNGDYVDQCEENPENCKFCKSSGCNLATSLSEYVDCIYCDGADNKNCVFDLSSITRTRSCHKACLSGLYPRTEDDNPAYEMARGCLDDMDLDDRDNCLVGDMPYCKACEGASCNRDDIVDNRKSCYVCEGSGCEDPATQACSAYRENDQCFTLFDSSNSVERMGCVSDLDTSYITANKRQLLLCDEDDCNIFENFPASVSCSYCNSLTDVNCAVNSKQSSVLVACQIWPNTECYSHVDSAGVTYRGCLSDVDDELFEECNAESSESCEICASNNCNTEVYPTNRRSCNRCDSSTDSDCNDKAAQFASICPIYNADDTCVSRITGDHIQRGCSSDFTCDEGLRDTCRICDSDNCNTVNLLASYIGDPGRWQNLPLNCYVCEGDDCSGVSTIHKCEDNNVQTCVTVFGSSGSVEKRGCSDAVTATHANYCDENPDKCMACKSSGCNDATTLDSYVDCYFCDTENSDECLLDVAGLKRTRKCQTSCMVALYPRSSAEDPAYELSRSCLDDMDIDDREACSNGEMQYCNACEGSLCNTMSLPEERLECYKCQEGDCEDATSQTCTAYHPSDQCYILFDSENSITAMGCRSEFEQEVVTSLVKQKQLVLCDGKSCNSFDSIASTKLCSVCNSENDARCATNPNLIGNVERCSALPYTNCFTRINSNGYTERGCLASLEDEVFYGCLQGTDGLCETCTNDRCNEIDVYPSNRLSCHQCSSSSDTTCTSAPSSSAYCPLYVENDSCITNYQDGITTRGCASSLKCDDENDPRTCRTCSTTACNTINLENVGLQGEPGRWQDTPINCYTCAGETDCESSTLISACTDNQYQNCLTVFNADGKVIQRGCSDSVEANNQAYCNANADKCLACNSNGCNVAASLNDYVECLACDTDSNGDCVNNLESITKTRLCYQNCMTALYKREEGENPAYGLSRSCYDDMDVDDRDACAAGTKEYCQTCNTAKCNTASIPATRLSCYICDGDDCQDPQAESCANYRENDKCYIRYDETNSIIAMGCRSGFSNTEADYLLSQKRLFLCDDDNCNTIDNLPTAQTCVLCNSRTDSNCAVLPTSVVSTTSCAVLPITECYSRVLSDGSTERGCLSNLYDDEFVSCFNGNSATCSACTGARCNNKVYPTDRLSCHVCDSSSDSTCAASPNSLAVCPVYNAEESCVTTILNDITYRGCSSSLECDESNDDTCEKCTDDGCNTVNLAERQDDNYGKWQDLPLKCLTCSGDNCNSASSESLTCENNNEQDCMTVFDSSGAVTRRGCSDEVLADLKSYCRQNSDNCYKCKSNDCNTASAKSEFISCVSCDSHKDLDCIWNPQSNLHSSRLCQGSCMTALYPSDSSTNPSYDLIRTCLNDKETADQTTCSAGSDSNCKSCTTANCNIEDLPTNRLKCHICDGDSCEEPTSEQCPLYKSGDQCFTMFDTTNTVVQMGCVSSFRTQDLETIIKTKQVYICDGEDCNSLEKLPSAQKCAVCDSSEDSNCATNPLEIGQFETCSALPYTSCYTKISNTGLTQRGCLSELPENDFYGCLQGSDEKCSTCTGEACNRDIFPANRLQCYACTSADDSNCESFPTSSSVCATLTDAETCVTALSDTTTIRGCSSDIYCDSEDKSTCRSCSGSACNTIDLRNKVDDNYHGVWQDLPLTCHSCEGEQCLSSLGATYTCTGNLEQDCMTVFSADGDVTRRGCSDDVEDYDDQFCRLNPTLCFKCKSNECNTAWSTSEYIDCIFCNSTTNAACTTSPTSTGFATRSCVKECMVAIKGEELIRSCLDDKEILTRQVCRDGANGSECASCEGNNCNNFIFPTNRLSCHVCSGNSCSSSTSTTCANYVQNDYCFAKYENGVVDLMGCASSYSAENINEWTSENKLYRCEGNDCNDVSKLPTGTSCISCDSSVDVNCARNPSAIQTTETCNVLSSDCVVRVNSMGHTLRGCWSNLDATQQNCEATGACSRCSTENCNSAIFPANRRSCYSCSSRTDEECAKSPQTSLICARYVANDRCVTRNVDGLIERGCESDITCNTEDAEHCAICVVDSCNTDDLTDAAIALTSSFVLLLISAFVTILGFNRH